MKNLILLPTFVLMLMPTFVLMPHSFEGNCANYCHPGPCRVWKGVSDPQVHPLFPDENSRVPRVPKVREFRWAHLGTTLPHFGPIFLMIMMIIMMMIMMIMIMMIMMMMTIMMMMIMMIMIKWSTTSLILLFPSAPLLFMGRPSRPDVRSRLDVRNPGRTFEILAGRSKSWPDIRKHENNNLEFGAQKQASRMSCWSKVDLSDMHIHVPVPNNWKNIQRRPTMSKHII